MTARKMTETPARKKKESKKKGRPNLTVPYAPLPIPILPNPVTSKHGKHGKHENKKGFP